MRCQGQAERQYRRGVEQLSGLRSLPEPPSLNEPISVTQPKQNEKLTALEDRNVNDPPAHPHQSRAPRPRPRPDPGPGPRKPSAPENGIAENPKPELSRRQVTINGWTESLL